MGQARDAYPGCEHEDAKASFWKPHVASPPFIAGMLGGDKMQHRPGVADPVGSHVAERGVSHSAAHLPACRPFKRVGRVALRAWCLR